MPINLELGADFLWYAEVKYDLRTTSLSCSIMLDI